MEYLRSEVRRNDELYHRDGRPEITDAEYDELKRELGGLEARSHVAGAPGERTPVDDHTGRFVAYPHHQPMLSLEKAYSEADLRRFHDKVMERLKGPVRYVIEPKYDGIAISAQYENGKLARVLTRGDGNTGDDVTENALIYSSVPEALIRDGAHQLPSIVEIRGEMFMSLAEFARANLAREIAGQPSYGSPRNLAVGTLKSHQEHAEFVRNLDVVFYGIGKMDPTVDAPASQQELLSRLQTWGLPIPENVSVAETGDEMCSAVRRMASNREKWAFPSDGLVVKVDSRVYQNILGRSNQAPLWAMAYKFGAERRTTRLTAITLQVGRTGLITPVAELEPVHLAGATIRRANLHNAAEIARRDLRVGDYVVVERGGEVIPAVIGVDLTRRSNLSTRYVFPKHCPACAELLVQRNGQTAWRCPDPQCIAQVKRRVRHFASPSCVDIHGLGPATVEKLVDSGKIRSVSDIYRLRREDLSGMGSDASMDALFVAIEQSKSTHLWRFIHGFGIEGIGQRNAKALADAFPTMDLLVVASAADFARIEGIPSETAANAVDFFRTFDLEPIARAWKAGLIDRYQTTGR